MTRGAGRHVVRPLTREPSAGARWRPSSTVREDRWREEAVGAARIRQSSWQMGPQPHPGGLLPVQRKLAAPRRRCPEPGMRTIRRLCSRAVLVAEVDERRLVQSLTRLGLALRPRARRVKGRPKPAHGGKAAGTVAGSRRSRALAPQGERSRGSEHSSREGVLVSTKRSSLTSGSRRRAWRLHRAGPAERLDPVRGGLRQRTSEATPWARYADENSAAGWRHAERLSIEASPGPRSARSRPHPRPGPPPRTRGRWTAIGHAEAGGSPSSEAPPGDPREASGQRWIGSVGAAPAREQPGPSARESGSLAWVLVS
jgi:hypothetical protein